MVIVVATKILPVFRPQSYSDLMQTNALYYGDCLDWNHKWDDQFVDLNYLDRHLTPRQTKTSFSIQIELMMRHNFVLLRILGFGMRPQLTDCACMRMLMVEKHTMQ